MSECTLKRPRQAGVGCARVRLPFRGCLLSREAATERSPRREPGADCGGRHTSREAATSLGHRMSPLRGSEIGATRSPGLRQGLRPAAASRLQTNHVAPPSRHRWGAASVCPFFSASVDPRSDRCYHRALRTLSAGQVGFGPRSGLYRPLPERSPPPESHAHQSGSDPRCLHVASNRTVTCCCAVWF